jgi:Brp/Blh family beta-carotene 15,15'-monooxygenase
MYCEVAKSSIRADRLLFDILPPILFLVLSGLECVYPFSDRYAVVPFFLSIFLAGLPHGAIDLAVNSHLTRRSGLCHTLSEFKIYLGWITISLILALVTPLCALIVFAGFSVVHFGAADVAYRASPGRSDRWATVEAVIRGTLILTLPFTFHSAPATHVVNSVLNILGSMSTINSETMHHICLFLTIFAGGIAALCVGGLTRIGQTRAAYGLIFDLVILVVAFWVLHPLFAMGLYFLLIHSWRHIRRLIEFLGYDDRPLGVSLAFIHLRSLPLLIPTMFLIVGLLSWRSMEMSPANLVIASLAVYVVVTPAHHFLVQQIPFENSEPNERWKSSNQDFTLKRNLIHVRVGLYDGVENQSTVGVPARRILDDLGYTMIPKGDEGPSVPLSLKDVFADQPDRR